ncbi:hypothetical protein GGS23DRAFT_243586 [Durotheca rogersii]|uniref:uncharacterized protein n=1 Tax=Durotheca rogersii TaxID=419775 RepID=UPI002220462B|nr:uncharacterized protein GGS23DRAFT_243586 [Durotheca rogersii]KAI5860286.1 hypothetical protein GGS23DRAFT_243586 [Durotheca rogersii]
MAPNFGDPTLFPTFQELSSSTPASPPFLLAQIREDMTITKPTLIVRDRTGAEFAVTFDDGDHRGLDAPPSSSSAAPHDLLTAGGGASAGKRFRRGHTLVVPAAAREARGGGGKKDVVRVPRGGGAAVRVLPAPLERVLEVGAVMAAVAHEERSGSDGEGGGARRKTRCGACGKDEDEGEGEEKVSLMRCTGCGTVAYCSKACQVRGWSELDHKTNCKLIRAIKEIWP